MSNAVFSSPTTLLAFSGCANPLGAHGPRATDSILGRLGPRASQVEPNTASPNVHHIRCVLSSSLGTHKSERVLSAKDMAM
jgi:hypothetical protein